MNKLRSCWKCHSKGTVALGCFTVVDCDDNEITSDLLET